jgi:hypothetical protein
MDKENIYTMELEIIMLSKISHIHKITHFLTHAEVTLKETNGHEYKWKTI